jgi:hypothetical protein
MSNEERRHGISILDLGTCPGQVASMLQEGRTIHMDRRLMIYRVGRKAEEGSPMLILPAMEPQQHSPTLPLRFSTQAYVEIIFVVFNKLWI